jgi:hypothetical protein
MKIADSLIEWSRRRIAGYLVFRILGGSRATRTLPIVFDSNRSGGFSRRGIDELPTIGIYLSFALERSLVAVGPVAMGAVLKTPNVVFPLTTRAELRKLSSIDV